MNDLEAFFLELAREGRAPLARWPVDEELAAFGLRRDGATVLPPADYEALHPARLRAALSRRADAWLTRLDVYPVIGSTSVELMSRAVEGSVAGHAALAEVQVQGRGRRGRSWASPFGTNLATSLGFGLSRPPAELGGLSLAVGLAVLDALERHDIPELALKWPNDLLLAGDKLGGILIELARPGGASEVVIGVGLNLVLPAEVRAALPPGVADLSRLPAPPPRNRLAADMISSIVEFVAAFDREGFAPFRMAFEQRHYHHGRRCDVLQGERRIAGVVTGVTDQGELLLDTEEGPRTFNGGEVSLRPQ